MRNFAIDASQKNKKEAEKFSSLFWSIYQNNEMAFSMEKLKEAIDRLPKNLQLALFQHFHLVDDAEIRGEANKEDLLSAINLLKELDGGDTAFSINSIILCLMEKQKEVTTLTNYCKEWDIPINTINISVRIKTALNRNGITTLNHLFSCNAKKLQEIRNLGDKAIEEIADLFKQYGLELIR